jgi:Peptidase family M28
LIYFALTFYSIYSILHFATILLMKKFLILVLILRGYCLVAQNADPAPFANTINTDELRAHLAVLTSDSLEGRETGTEGNLKAAKYIANYFEKLGLPKVVEGKSYFQRMVYTNEGWTTISMQLNGVSFKHQYNFYALPGSNPVVKGNTIKADEVIFMGYGIDDAQYSDYKKTDVKGKVIMIYQGEPLKSDSTSLITKTKKMSPWSLDWRKKLSVAYSKGVKAVLIIDPTIAKSIQENRRQFSRNITGDVENVEGLYANNLNISTEIALAIIGTKGDAVKKARERIEKGKKYKPVTLPCRLMIDMDKYFRQLIGNNVLGFIEGSDPVLKKEIVVVSAHYDHLGKRGDAIYHGADDNGSGSSTVLEITQAMVEAKKKGLGPKRSVLCLLMTGEEKGLLGSKYYVTYPIFPLENTVADVNIDMVGRVDEKYQDNPNYIYVIGADKLSTDLHDVNEAMNKTYTNLTLDYTYNDENDPNRYYYRSDHYNFAERGIPAIFYFNGTHNDYHMTTDTIDKINFEKMAKIAKLAFYTAWEIANRPDRLRLNKK